MRIISFFLIFVFLSSLLSFTTAAADQKYPSLRDRSDPLFVQALEVARFYYLLATDQLVSADLGKEMKEMLSKPAIQYKFVKGLKDRSGADVYRKSGTWQRFHADSGVIVREQHTYIIVAIAEHSRGAEGLTRLIVSVDDMMERIRPSSQ